MLNIFGLVVGVGVVVGIGVGVGSIVEVGVGVGSFVGVGDLLGIGVGEVLGSGLGEGVSVDVGVMLGSDVGLGVSMAGSLLEFEFWDSGFKRNIKSSVLFSESCPFPLNSSTPPELIVSAVDSAFAFLSTLSPAPGAVRNVPSPRGLLGVSKVTASTISPVSEGSSLSAILLLFESVAVLTSSHERVSSKLV